MPALPLLSLLMLQLAPTTLAQDRLTVCQTQARRDPAAAILTASEWETENYGADRSLPRQCLGLAYTSLLRWEAAELSFLSARAALDGGDPVARARLAAMAGNAALAGTRAQAALADFELAQADLASAGNPELAGEVAADRARALVALGRHGDAATALEQARRDAPQLTSAWLLSATLARRMEKLSEAQQFIETASALAPQDPAVGLEAGVIAVLAGRDDAARASWQSVQAAAPSSPEAETARMYLKQLEEPQAQ